jgi:HAD superfamily hydrolase (TIGR01490 family)
MPYTGVRKDEPTTAFVEILGVLAAEESRRRLRVILMVPSDHESRVPRRVAALFDLDRTLLDTSSARLYAFYLRRQGLLSRLELARMTWWSLLVELGKLDMATLMPRLLTGATGDDEAELRERCNRWFAEDVLPHLTRRGQERVREHQAQGHMVALVSASTQYVVQPMAEYLGIPGQFVCTRLSSREGRLTGKVEEPICYGQGKVVWAERFAVAQEVDLGASFFYTDSMSDLPLLERVGHPAAVNPDRRLKRLAQERGWPIERFY